MTDDFNNSSAGNAPTETPPGPGLGINDLKNLLMIVDLATKRGAFQPKEFSLIGEVYNRVDAFIEATTQAEKPAATKEG